MPSPPLFYETAGRRRCRQCVHCSVFHCCAFNYSEFLFQLEFFVHSWMSSWPLRGIYIVETSSVAVSSATDAAWVDQGGQHQEKTARGPSAHTIRLKPQHPMKYQYQALRCCALQWDMSHLWMLQTRFCPSFVLSFWKCWRKHSVDFQARGGRVFFFDCIHIEVMDGLCVSKSFFFIWRPSSQPEIINTWHHWMSRQPPGET